MEGVFYLGEIYNLTNAELKSWRDRIEGALSDYMQSGSVYLAYLIVVWSYEYLEAFAVNGTGIQAKLGRVKEFWADYSVELQTLFKVRSIIVHRCYNVDEGLTNRLLKYSKVLDLILQSAGFNTFIISRLRL